MRVEPIACWRPTAQAAATFAAPPYDVFDRDEARSYVEAHPGSFLEIDRPETLVDKSADMYAASTYQAGRERLEERRTDGTLEHADPALYLWRQERDGHAQTGVVCAVRVEDYDSGVIARHENTRREKEEDRVRHIRTLEAQTGPIFLCHRDSDAVSALVAEGCEGEPLWDFEDAYGVRNTVWEASAELTAALTEAFGSVPGAYIADGHHRAASAARVCHEMLAAGRDGACESFLAVLFAADQLEILPYNRVVHDRCGMSAPELVRAISAAGFDVAPSARPVSPTSRHHVGVYADGGWWEATAHDSIVPEDAVGSLDASILQTRVLDAVLGITDPTADERIEFVGGVRGLEELERRAGTEGVAFSLFATGTDELMAVSDAGLLMPPKSTWFEPKLLSGLFVRDLA